MRANSQETEDLVTFTEKILHGKLHFLYSETPPDAEESNEDKFSKKIAGFVFVSSIELSKPSPKHSHLI